MPVKYIAFQILLLLTLAGCNRLTGDPEDSSANEWRSYGHDFSNSKFSPLSLINRKNVHTLKEVWRYEDSAGVSGIFFNPLIAKGKMYVYTPSNHLAALNAIDGRLIWQFTPDSTDIISLMRGINFYDGKGAEPDVLYFVHGTTLYALDAENGNAMKDFGKNGKVDFYEGLSIEDSMRSEVTVTNTTPGVIYKDMLIIGCKVPDELPSTPGDIRAFNLKTGKLIWTFNTIPKPGEWGADTWPANARKTNGGANCWGGMALDEKRGIVYVPTASPSFDFYGADRKGQNLFANCLLALDATTGKRIWHFQTTHHDLWDRDNGSPPNLVRVYQNGDSIDAVALVTKLGYVFIFDRENGRPLFPINEIPVPTQGALPGEEPWPTQPFPEKPAPFARQGFSIDKISEISPNSTDSIKKLIEQNKYNTGVYEPPNLNGSIVVPAAHGGANWGGASFNPGTGILFVNSTDLPWFFKMIEIGSLEKNNKFNGADLFKMYCSSCHGPDKKGTAYGPNLVERVKSYSLMKVENIIRRGVEPMPSFNHLPREQLLSIALFVKGISKDQINPITIANSERKKAEPYSFSGYDFYYDKDGYPAIKPPWGTLNAIDLNKGEIIWKAPLGEIESLTEKGIPPTGLFNRGGGIATAGGLVFIGATHDEKFRAFDQENGKILWESKLPGIASSIPASYSIGGKQFVTVAVCPEPSRGYKGGYITYSIIE